MIKEFFGHLGFFFADDFRDWFYVKIHGAVHHDVKKVRLIYLLILIMIMIQCIQAMRRKQIINRTNGVRLDVSPYSLY